VLIDCLRMDWMAGRCVGELGLSSDEEKKCLLSGVEIMLRVRGWREGSEEGC
jgi:hypothetical protein